MSEDVTRQITEREIFDELHGNRHSACLKTVCQEVVDNSKKYGIPLSCFNISALTFQKYQPWERDKNYIEQLRKERQLEEDKYTIKEQKRRSKP